MANSAEEQLLDNFENYINENLVQLCSNTIVGSDLLVNLLAKRIIHDFELEEITHIATNYEKARKLFQLIKLKVHQLPDVIACFRKVLQPGQANILQKFLDDNQ